MTDNELIATALGWINIIDNDVYDIDVWVRNDDGVEQQFGAPKYDADLSLIHEAEAMLTDDEWRWYIIELFDVIDPDRQLDWQDSITVPGRAFRHATAKQCADAIAKVLEGRDPSA